jgi:integrase
MADERKQIGLQEVRSLAKNSEIWDTKVPGFGARRQRSDAVAYVLLYRTSEGRSRRYTIGRHGAPWTPDTARKEAQRLLGKVAEKEDPNADKKARRTAATVAELCDQYQADVDAGRLLTRRKVPKKASTIATDRGRIEGHIKPLLGKLRVASVTAQDVEGFMEAVADGKTSARGKAGKKGGALNRTGGMGTASRTVGLLGAIFTFAIRKRLRSDNPVHGVMRPADGRRERRLSDAEYRALGTALTGLTATDAMLPAPIAVARFLALTGWRSGEALKLTWKDVDLASRIAVLPDTKTGKSVRPLSKLACDVLRSLPRSNDLVFPATRAPKGKATGGCKSAEPPTPGVMSGWPKLWARIAKKAKLPPDVTPHVLRHSFISLAADLGYSEPSIAACVGHKGQTVTSRYIHSADAVLLAAADAVATETTNRMGDPPAEAVVVPLRTVA